MCVYIYIYHLLACLYQIFGNIFAILAEIVAFQQYGYALLHFLAFLELGWLHD